MVQMHAGQGKALPLPLPTLQQLTPAVGGPSFPASPPPQALLQQEMKQREAAWVDLPEDERQWLQAQHVVLTSAPQSEEEAAQQGRSLQQLIEQWNALPADKQWRTAWADLLPHQQQLLLGKYGAAGPEALQAAAGMLFGALPPEERAQLQSQIPPYEERILVAASNLQRQRMG